MAEFAVGPFPTQGSGIDRFRARARVVKMTSELGRGKSSSELFVNVPFHASVFQAVLERLQIGGRYAFVGPTQTQLSEAASARDIDEPTDVAAGEDPSRLEGTLAGRP